MMKATMKTKDSSEKTPPPSTDSNDSTTTLFTASSSSSSTASTNIASAAASISSSSNKKDGKSVMTPLASNFQPGPYDVICARGKDAKKHPGNVRYRAMAQASLEKYSKVTTKMEKSVIVSDIVEAVRASSPNGGFVKFDAKTKSWFEVGDHLAREKVGQYLRDSLHEQYRSSTKAKKRRRDIESAKSHHNVESLIQSNGVVASRMDLLAVEARTCAVPVQSVSIQFTKANMDILEALKKDKKLVDRFQELESTAVGESKYDGNVDEVTTSTKTEKRESEGRTSKKISSS